MGKPADATLESLGSSRPRRRSPTNQKGDRLRQLRAFCYAAQEGGLSRAARRLNLTQPAISRHVSTLEEELDTQLFERRGPYIHLTEAGETLFALAMPLVDGMDGLDDTFIQRRTTGVADTIQIAASPVGAVHILPRYVQQYRKQYPDVKLHLKPVSCREGLARLRAYDADFFIGSLDAVPDDLEYCPFLVSDEVLITPLDHPFATRQSVTLREAAQYPAILSPLDTDTGTSLESAAHRSRLKIDDALETEGYDVIKRYVEAGLGISVVPSICVGKTDRVAAVPFEQAASRQTYGVITVAGRPLSRAATRFVALLGPELPSLA